MRLEWSLTAPVLPQVTPEGHAAQRDPRRPPRSVYLHRGEGEVAATILDGAALAAGESVRGPAVVDLATTGVLVPPKAQLHRTPAGDFVITREREEASR